MATYGVKYIGSKASLVPFIVKTVEDSLSDARSAIDVFTGTTRVAQAFKEKGITVTTSDLSWASKAYSNTWIGNEGTNAHLAERLAILNGLEGSAGWITKNYCDVLGAQNGVVRVWQAKNGKKADAAREQIKAWLDAGEIQQWESDTLVTALILALDKVDNTVGVQQAYLKEWCTRSYKDININMPIVAAGPKGRHIEGDCLTIDYPQADFAYLDPPYSSHSYATYYHIWDSIAEWDKPVVGLKTNRRVDRISGHESYDSTMLSGWNSKKSALNSFEKLIQRLPVKHVLVSYNNESLVPIESLVKIFKKYPSCIIQEIDYKRNIMCQIGNAAKEKTDETIFKTENKEFLFHITK